jgi:hypothetical protein
LKTTEYVYPILVLIVELVKADDEACMLCGAPSIQVHFTVSPDEITVVP